MAYGEQRKPDMRMRILGLITLFATIVGFGVAWLMGDTIDFALDVAIQNNPLYSKLPSAAQSTFTGVVNYQLTTFDFGVIIVAFLAVCGTIAAIFRLQSVPDENGWWFC